MLPKQYALAFVIANAMLHSLGASASSSHTDLERIKKQEEQLKDIEKAKQAFEQRMRRAAEIERLLKMVSGYRIK